MRFNRPGDVAGQNIILQGTRTAKSERKQWRARTAMDGTRALYIILKTFSSSRKTTRGGDGTGTPLALPVPFSPVRYPFRRRASERAPYADRARGANRFSVLSPQNQTYRDVLARACKCVRVCVCIHVLLYDECTCMCRCICVNVRTC